MGMPDPEREGPRRSSLRALSSLTRHDRAYAAGDRHCGHVRLSGRVVEGWTAFGRRHRRAVLALVISPVTAAALLLPIFVASDMVGLYLYRRQFSARNLAILIPAALVGVGIGWAFSAHVSPLFVGFLVGLTGLAFCLNAWFGARFRGSAPKGADVPSGLFWGALTVSPASFRIRARRLTRCMSCRSGWRRWCSPAPPPFCLPSSMPRRSCPTGPVPVRPFRHVAALYPGAGRNPRHRRRQAPDGHDPGSAVLPSDPGDPVLLSIKSSRTIFWFFDRDDHASVIA